MFYLKKIWDSLMHKKSPAKLKRCEDIRQENTLEPICCDVSKLTVLQPYAVLNPKIIGSFNYREEMELDNFSMCNNPSLSSLNLKSKSIIDNKRHIEDYYKGYLGDDELSFSEGISGYQAPALSRTSSSIRLHHQVPFNSKSSSVKSIMNSNTAISMTTLCVDREEPEGHSIGSSCNNINVYQAPTSSPVSSISSIQLNHKAPPSSPIPRY